MSTAQIILLDELETSTKSDFSHLKMLTGETVIRERAPYARFDQTYYRHASFAGCINRADFLTDTTGNDRWLVFSVAALNYLGVTTDIRDAAMAQAYALYVAGYQYWLTRKEIEEINRHNVEYEAASPEEDILRDNFAVTDTTEGMTATEILQHMQDLAPAIRVQPRQLGALLRKIGYTQRRTHGGVRRYNIRRSDVF